MVGAVNAVVRFRGSIRESSVDPYLRILQRVRDKRKYRGLLFDISSGGGGDVPSTDLYLAVKRVARVKPVVATIGSVGASGGYLATLGAQKIFAYEGSDVGSIGVVMPHVAVGSLLDRLGVKVEMLSHGRHKSAFQGIRDLTEEERSKVLRVGEVSYNSFVDAVARERKKPREEILKLATGEFWSGRQALQLGLIDALGDRETALDDLSRMTGVPRQRSVEVFPRRPWRSRLLGFPFVSSQGSFAQEISGALRETVEDLVWDSRFFR
jgi:protease-4